MAQCPKCGSNNIQIVTEEKGYSAETGCCGAILLGPIGLILGLCGTGKKNKRMCVDCGKKF